VAPSANPELTKPRMNSQSPLSKGRGGLLGDETKGRWQGVVLFVGFVLTGCAEQHRQDQDDASAPAAPHAC
jgi:hypothetical protein